jgi:Arc/MetJ family transcription regulator
MTANRVVRKNMRLNQDVLDRARRILGTRTETETVEQALQLVAFRHEVVDGIRAVAGTGAIRDVYDDG